MESDPNLSPVPDPDSAPAPDPNDDYEVVPVKDFDRHSTTRMDDPAGTMSETGLTALNGQAAMQFASCARKANVNPDDCSATYRVSLKRGLVEITPVPETVEEKVAVLQRSDGTYSIHLGPVLMKYPELRPAGRRKVKCFIDEKSGKFTISLKTGHAMLTQTRSSSTQQSAAKPQGKAAAASQPEPEKKEEA